MSVPSFSIYGLLSYDPIYQLNVDLLIFAIPVFINSSKRLQINSAGKRDRLFPFLVGPMIGDRSMHRPSYKSANLAVR